MTLNYNQYGKVALIVAKTNGNPKDNWVKAVQKVFPDSKSSQKKNCPKSAFLGLCKEGLVKGIAKGKYTRSRDNKAYAEKAIEILRSSPKATYTPNELWAKVKTELFIKKKAHNSQMDVVLALWEHHYISEK